MSAQIIQFPVKRETIQTVWPYNINGTPVNPPKTGSEYLELCKQFMEPEDYTDLLVGIMDRDAYDGLEKPLRKVVDNYYNFF